MNDIPMGMKWVHKTNGKWVTVVATLPNDGHGEQVRISDRNGPQGRSREIDVDIDWFYDNFTPVNDPDEPHVGETWTTNQSYRQVKIMAVAEGLVVTDEPIWGMKVTRLDTFMVEAKRGAIKRPVPDTDHRGYDSMYFPIKIVDGKPTIDFGICRWEHTMGNAGRPWTGSIGHQGVVRVPLMWDQATTVPYPTEEETA